jgi:glycosyltransferase involved in cell wall biosynthesis
MNIVSPIDCYTGYGITGYNIWKHIFDINNQSVLFPVAHPNVESDWNTDCIKHGIDNKIHFDPNQPSFKLWHSNDFFTKPYGNSKYGVLSFFETDKIQELDKKSYNLADIIFMPSEWAKNVLEQNGITKPIVVCPQGVDTNIFNGIVPEDKKENNTYIFINIGKWEIRKGHDILIEIFNSAFESHDDVELWMVNHNPFLNTEQTNKWIEFYKNSKLSDKIRFFPRLPNQKTVANVMSYADCGIFPSRGEGWNNEAIELMAMNKPIIITNYSAHTEYCNSNNSYLINIDQIESAIDNIWFHGKSGNWATIGQNQIDQAIEYMRYVYKNNIRTNNNGLKTAQNLTWQKTANIIYDHMNN